jgi:hypothetical protein
MSSYPEFYRQQESSQSAEEKARMMRTVMRIDPFPEFSAGPAERRRRMIELSEIEPADARSWRAFLDYWFDQAAKGGAVGIKQLQAYRRNLDFTLPQSERSAGRTLQKPRRYTGMKVVMIHCWPCLEEAGP